MEEKEKEKRVKYGIKRMADAVCVSHSCSGSAFSAIRYSIPFSAIIVSRKFVF